MVVPTYNRSAYVRHTLANLARQTLPPDEFDVIVADDGSTDDTREVVESFAGKLQVAYHYQPDEGFRAPAARNAGARLARSPLLVFFDAGVIPGPDCLRQHLALHADPQAHRAVIGYAYAYNPPYPMPGIAEALAELPPEAVVERFRRNPAFLDIRHVEMAACDFDVSRRALPWTLFFSLNCSVRADDYWRAGGFAEAFRKWGLEDMEVAYRLHRDGVSFVVSRDAWIVESPHERSEEANWLAIQENIDVFLARHPEPVIELGWGLIKNELIWEWDDEYQRLTRWLDQIRDRQVIDELAGALARMEDPGRIAVLGAGAAVPATMPDAVLLEPDGELCRSAADDRQRTHALGLRTPLADSAVDTVLITSRLAGLWDRWGPQLLAEGRRIGRRVHLTGDFGDPVLGLRTDA
ncbi:glycosyltransferase [Solwaraspora sp. WMMA2056]|uniref:glycosyltransferase n=1 Tax=Solwaraspora sp. WMMA2056 TaxID=3015161 RepID=UPI00259B49B6|nr:glycosyltransferase [Solwaraspora sp. WMMA2056]WJK38630.1 glycosyltransferase [Solwaraspora sp. WMMA2056]